VIETDLSLSMIAGSAPSYLTAKESLPGDFPGWAKGPGNQDTLVSDEKYIGLDVHQATISVAVMDATGKVVMESNPGGQGNKRSRIFCGSTWNLVGDLRRRNLVSLVVRPAPSPCRY